MFNWTLLEADNLDSFFLKRLANLIYADMIYENLNFDWVDHY